MAYTPNPTDATQPTEDKFVETAAAEFRALKNFVLVELEELEEQIAELGSPGAIIGSARADLFSGNDVAVDFTLSRDPGQIANLDVSISGVTQRPNLDYTWLAGTTLTFAVAPVLGNKNILVRYMEAIPVPDNENLANTIDVTKGDALVGVRQPWAGAVGRTQHEKNTDLASSADVGVLAASLDNTLSLQAMLNHQHGEVIPGIYNFTLPLKIPNLSHFVGKYAGIGVVGIAPNVKWALRKTTNSTVVVTNFEPPNEQTVVDCLAYFDPNWIDNGISPPQKISLERLSFAGAGPAINDIGIYIEQGMGHTFRELDFAGFQKAIYAKEAFLCTLDRVQAFGKIQWQGGTSVTFTNCLTNGSAGIDGGFVFESLIYSVMNGCAAEKVGNSGYRFNFCTMVLNGCGCEDSTTVTSNSGVALAIQGGNKLIINEFVAIPRSNQAIPPITVGPDNEVHINGGTSYFPSVLGITAVDIYVWGPNSTVVYRDHVFLNGTKDNPSVQFGPGTAGSKVVVHFGDNYKVYTTTGAGDTVVTTFNSSGTWLPRLQFDTPNVAPTYTIQQGTWKKVGGIVTVTGRIALSNKGTGTGVALLAGFPFPTVGAVELNFALQALILAGPFIGTMDAGAQHVILQVRGVTGDGVATEANITNTTQLWFSASYSTNV